MSRESCPNCGRKMGILREQHQRAGSRGIWLRWLICSYCHHVALDDWSFADRQTTGSATEINVPLAREKDRTQD